MSHFGSLSVVVDERVFMK